MAIAQGTGAYVARGVYRVTWLLQPGASVGSWTQLPHLPDRTLVLSSTGGFNGTMVLEGNNALASSLTGTGGKGYTLNDSRGVGNAISLTTGKAVTILENVNMMRPKLTALTTTVTTKCTVTILAESRLR